ncbi:capsule assembly Wzi family protein [Roseivirga sp.]|uniref:capsule assembly Wzi family protein n=1 Tax=Roseivirga sp. TaxID=1964215 RepID=UPI003B8CE7A8
MKKLLILLFIVVCQSFVQAQSTFIPYNRDYYHLIDRFQIKYGNQENLLQTTFKPIRRVDLSNFLLAIASKYDSLSAQDKFNFEYLMNDNWEWTNSTYNENDKSWWDLLYTKKSDLYYYKTKNFNLRINPVAEFTIGNDPDAISTVFTNTRGIEAQGMIDDKIGFYTFLTTTQAVFPYYVRQSILDKNAFPNEGFWKRDDGEYDLTHARGYFTFDLSQSIDIQAGYDKKFIGKGLRSMVLSDYSSPFLFGQINTRLGKFQYTNLFGELTADIIFANSNSPGDGDYPKKYLSMHRLGVNITNSLEIGVFETIISSKANINYFNPLVFYRAIEQQEGSPDNVLIGLDVNVNLKGKYQLYGQFMLDEFVLDALRSGEGDWRNKFGIQLGAKYIDAFDVPNLDLQAEYNVARPYFYASETSELSYTNYRNPLAHPMGANFKEIVLAGRYQPMNKLSIMGKIIRTNFGEDENGLNYGGNLQLSTDDRIGNLGNTIGQGVATTNTYIEISGSYMLVQNLFVDLRNIYRNFDSAINARSKTSFITMLSLRWNLPQRQHEF